jgi:biotin carboxyl carrier protein
VTVEPRKALKRPEGERAAGDFAASIAGRAEAERSAEDRAADHAAIDRLADELVPALIAKLSSSGLAEIEIGEGDWTVRVRRPADAARESRRTAERGSRAQPGHAGHGHAPGGFEAHRTSRDTRPAAGLASTNGSAPGGSGPEPGSAGHGPSGAPNAHRAVATSPAVGIFQPRAEARIGTRVRAGDRLGAVDLLGVPQEVVAPADGIVGETLAEAGEAVEYGQELVVIELSARATAGGGSPASDRGDG